MTNGKIAASILGVENKKEMIKKIISKDIHHIHYDAMDGEFVEAISLPAQEIIEVITSSEKHYADVHLMVKNPYLWIAKLANYVDAISFHYEACSEQEILNIINEFKGRLKLGLVINLDIELAEILPLLVHFDFVLVMSVQAGKGGQKFNDCALEKIKLIRQTYPNIFIQVDGGINVDNINFIFKAGAQNTVIGAFLIKNIDDDNVLSQLKKLTEISDF